MASFEIIMQLDTGQRKFDVGFKYSAVSAIPNKTLQ